MFKLKKIIYILMIIITILTSFSICFGQSKVNAAISLNEEITLTTRDELIRCEYDGEPISVECVYYEKDGEKYLAYGLDRNKDTTVTYGKPYSVSIDSLVTNQRVWRAIINGYPFKTPEELGCDRLEAYYATKIAVYDAFYNYDLDKFTEYLNSNSKDTTTIRAIKTIIQAARSQEKTKPVGRLDIKEENSSWQIDSLDNNYVSKIYTVTESVPGGDYKVSITGKNIKTFKITDITNNPKTTFSSEEKFKILLPISDLKTSGEFNINITASLKTYPIYHGKNLKEDSYEDFAIIFDEYETVQRSYKQTYEKNKTKITILKKDGDTGEPLKDAFFNLLDSDKSIIYSELKTNEQGIIEIPYLMPGLYYLEETIAPDGYYGYDELIEVNIEMQGEEEITVDNFKEEGEKVVPSKPNQEHYTPTKRLPTTGC